MKDQWRDAARKGHVKSRSAREAERFISRIAVGSSRKCKLDFGPWEQIFYGEFDGRRAKRVLIKVIGE